jgi:hypothetical protein
VFIEHVEVVLDYSITSKWTIQKWLETILQNQNVMNYFYIGDVVIPLVVGKCQYANHSRKELMFLVSMLPKFGNR